MESKRVAVSILLRTRRDATEALLVERNPRLKFFGGYLAFPGGTLEEQDREVPVRGERLGRLGEDFPLFVAAAARELFEETGLWLARGGPAPDEETLTRERRRMLAGDVTFSELLETHRHYVDAADFSPLCRITTPPFAPIRYDTWFVDCTIPLGGRVDIWDGELLGGGLTGTSTALESWRQGHSLIAPPVLILLAALERGADGFAERVSRLTASYARGKLHRVYFTPGVLLAPLATPTRPPATHTNTYILGERKLYVIDPSPVDETEQEKLWELLDELLREGRTLEGILLTHYHPDHVGALIPCSKRYPLPVLAHHETLARLPALARVHPLEHGTVLDLGSAPDGSSSWRLHVLHVPGHAPGHLAFKESRYGALLVGDLISTLSSILIDPRDGHLGTYLRSLRLLESLATGMVYPGHGPPAREGRKAIRAQLRHRQQREEQLLSALSYEPQPAGDLALKVYTDVDASMLELAQRSLLSGLVKLEEEGRVSQTAAGYRLIRTK